MFCFNCLNTSWLCHIVAALSIVHLVKSSPIPMDDLTSENAEQILRNAKASEIRNYMNVYADPCKDFYEFACGNWNRINPANSYEHISTGFFETMQKALNRKIKAVLRADVPTSPNAIDEKVKNFYESCVNLGALKNVYTDKLKEIIKEFGEMPLLVGDQWREEEFDWVEILGKIAYKYEISVLLGYDIMSDFVDNTVNRLYIGHPELPLESKSMYLDESNAQYRAHYRQNIVNVLKKFLGVKPEVAEKVSQEFLMFEQSLALGIVDEQMGLQLDEMAQLVTIEEMHQKYYPHLDIVRLVNISLGSVPTAPIYEMIEGYQQNLILTLKHTPKRVVANYIFYILVENFILKTPKDKSELETKCVDNTKKYFAKILDNMVYRTYNNNATEEGVLFMWHEIKTTFKNMLESGKLYWLGENTRNYAIEKLETMRIEINSYENTNFTEEFGSLVVNKHDYVENLKAVMVLNAQHVREKLSQPPKPLDAGELLSFTPANVIVENKIKVPVSLLQPHYVWSPSYPNAVKYGYLGSLISHELIHGFDDTGRNFDKTGNSREWWDAASTNAFVNRTKCFINQYKKYTYNGQLLPEMASQSENIADNGGVRLAYDAYTTWYEDAMRTNQNVQKETFSRLNYTSEQLFFISYAQIWCSDIHPAVRNLQVSTDTHVPSKFRVIGPLSNSEEFSKAFKCPIDSEMNPTKKCMIY